MRAIQSTPEETMQIGDSYTILYAYLVRGLLNDFPERGERAAREATRRFGRDRGLARREAHLLQGYKINMKNLFSVGGDLPSDPRFRRDLQELSEQVRNSHTLICPMSDLWKQIGEREIGRMYCEEFHFACYNEYAYGCTQVNLARTLTQNDAYCSFNVKLRPSFLPEGLRENCFEDLDPDYEEPKEIPKPSTAKEGFNSLCIRILYYMLEVAEEEFGEDGSISLRKSMNRFAENSAERTRQRALETEQLLDEEFAERNNPFWVHVEDEKMLEKYKKYQMKDVLEKEYSIPFRAALGI